MNRNHKLLLAVALATLTGAALAADRPLSLLPASGADQVPGVLVAASSQLRADLDRTPAQFSWAIPAENQLVAQAPQVRESREYWTRASGAQLDRGFALHTTAPGALVRVSPVDASAKSALNLDQVEIRKGGAAYGKRTAMANAADSAQLEAAGAAFPEGTIAFRLRPEVGAGKIELALARASGNFLVHVFEPESDRVLKLGSDRDTVLASGELKLTARYEGSAPVDAIAGVMTSPSGRTLDLEFVRQGDGSFVAKATPQAEAANGPVLWEVHTFATAEGGAVQRDVKTAVAVATPSARLNGSAGMASAGASERAFGFGLEVASAGRYELRGVLYATSESGTLAPAAVAHSAAWLEPGQRRIELRYDAAALANGPWRAPYEIRDLVLSNQADMAAIERRGRALRSEAR